MNSANDGCLRVDVNGGVNNRVANVLRPRRSPGSGSGSDPDFGGSAGNGGSEIRTIRIQNKSKNKKYHRLKFFEIGKR